MTKIASILFALVGAAMSAAVAEDHPADWFVPEQADAELLILGTFHFKDAGLDTYKPEVDIDILSDERQRELDDVLDRLAAWKPTKILIEWKVDKQMTTDERYQAYLADEFVLGANEVYQVGFKLARRLGHDRVINVDVLGRKYEGLPDDLDAYAEAKGQMAWREGPWDERYMALYAAIDHAKADRSLRQTLLAMNTEEALERSHGHYVLRGVAVGDDDEYPAVDGLTGWWYNRNLRIYANVLRQVEAGDRILLLIGAGHVPIIRHAVVASPELALVEASDVLDRAP